MSRPLRSFMRRLIVSQIVAMGLCWSGLLVGLFVVMSRFENGDLDRRMSYFAAILAETASAARDQPVQMMERLKAVEAVFVNGVIEELESARHYAASYQVIDREDRVLFSVGIAGDAAWSSAPGFGEHIDHGTHYRTVLVRSADGAVSVLVAESDAVRWASVWPMLRLIGISQLAIFLACILVLYWSGRRGVRPIGDMARSVANRRAGELAPIRDQIGYRETAPLIAAFNELLARESRRLDTERGFLADAAHELRTPLAALMTMADRVVDSPDEATRRAAARRLDGASQRIAHLLSQLLMTARIDASSAFSELESVDAAELTRHALADLVPNARKKDLTLSFDGPECAFVSANSQGLRAIVDNIVDNAIRYTPSGGNVQIRLGVEEDVVQLEIKDDGPGIAPEHHDAVFERFFRIPGNEEEGGGLGLAIVRRLVLAYGGRVQLARGLAGRGLCVAVKLPSAAQPV